MYLTARGLPHPPPEAKLCRCRCSWQPGATAGPTDGNVEAVPAEPEKPCNMEELYKDASNLPMDVTSSPSAMANNKLENGVAQLITAEAWNINSADLMKKALSPLVTVPAPSILTPPAESQSGVALKVAGSAAPQMPATNTATPYVMTTQGPVPLPVLLEQHVFQHLNSPLGTQTPLEKEETKPFDLLHPREFPQMSRHTVIKMGGENEALDLSMKGPPVPQASEAAPPPPPPEDGALDLSLASCRKPGGPHGDVAGTSPTATAEAGAHPTPDKLPGPAAPFAPCKPQEASGKVEGRGAGGGAAELLRQPQKWLVEPAGRAGCEPKAGNNIEIVSTSQTAKVIVSVKDADSVLQCYDVKSPPEPRDSAEALRKPVKNRS
ncbi:retinoic acid-induced protein 2 [Patagioenas fasciata monilis]|uniref:Retinoic acid-induced protein 2 n=1 Tax=Patagioenas fasciata monilis TaxID=372326 RepID=A0A1V4JCX9_PATFA|nr:retinoic acid-induced protein 2 [Patagioenas fasciata monilis]